ncbi:MAG TPA: hypothetical protein VII47_00850 [Actinomycetota bacterium]|jgi:hypothetical protein
MAEDDLKGDDLLREASKIFNTPSPAAAGGTSQNPETTGTPPAPAPSSVKPDDIKSDEDLFREANRVLDT